MTAYKSYKVLQFLFSTKLFKSKISENLTLHLYIFPIPQFKINIKYFGGLYILVI